MAYFLLAIVLLALDQGVKYIVKINLEMGHTIPIIENVFHLTHIRNYGAAFSILQGKQLFLSTISIIAIVGILIFIWLERKKAHPLILMALTFILGGGLGNLLDRLLLGYVVDFIDFRVFPIFNMADVFVTCGSVLLIIYLFVADPERHKGKKKDEAVN